MDTLREKYCALSFVSLFFTSLSYGFEGSELPPPPTMDSIDLVHQLRLALVINHHPTGKMVLVTDRQGEFSLDTSALTEAGLPADRFTSPVTVLNTVPGLGYEYDSAAQRLLIIVPPDWLPHQSVFTGNQPPPVPALSGSGALFNYDIYTTRTSQDRVQSSTWNELRVFTPYAGFSSTGTLRTVLKGGGERGYRRYDTSFKGFNEASALSWQVGDLVTGSLNWSTSVRMGGVSIRRDFSIRPDIMTYPLPAFSGQTAVPTTADLFINGYRTNSVNIDPGPFTLTNLPYVNGAGEAVIVTTDALGRRVSTTQPFYVASTLLAPGLSDGALSIGALRRGYGVKDFSYGEGALSASYRHGVSDYLTLESHAEGARDLALFGLGAVVKVGHFGVVNASATTSEMAGKQGEQFDWGYQYGNARFSFAVQQNRRDKQFGNLALYDLRQTINDPLSYSLSQSSGQYSAAASLGDYGSLGLAYFDLKSFSGDRIRLLNLSWSKSVWGNSMLSVSANRDPAQNDWALALSVFIPLGGSNSINLNAQRDAKGNQRQMVNYSHSMPSEGGFKWDLGYANQPGGRSYQQAALGWRNQQVQVQGGVYGEPNNYNQWAEMMGSLVYMDNTLLAANQIGDAFAIISTEGYSDIGVSYENQYLGVTNRRGYLLVPSVSSYYPARFSIDTLDLPANIYADTTEQRISISRQSGYVITFPVQERKAASLIFHDQNDNPLPLSSLVVRKGKADSYIGWDGLAYLEFLSQDNLFQIITPQGSSCYVQFTLLEEQDQQLRTYGPLRCQLNAP